VDNASRHSEELLGALTEVAQHTGAALVELAHGTTRLMPTGVGRREITDLFDKFEQQLGR
jgi:hypothetical protein